MGQFRAVRCPLCDGDNGESKWTCPSCTALVDVHRELLRNLQQWRSLFEADEVPDVLVATDHRAYSLWDVIRFYEHRTLLPPRQQLSMQFCLFENMKERDAALRMGIKPSNPVSIYSTIGITSLLTKAVAGDLSGYTIELTGDALWVS